MRAHKSEKREIVIEVDVRKLVFGILTAFMCLIALFSLFVYVASFMTVRHVEIDGVLNYHDRSQLISASGIDFGDRLYSTDIGEAEENILNNCVFVESVSLKRKFPNKIIMTVTEKTPQWYIEITEDFYILDNDLTVLQETNNEESLKERGLTKLTLPKVKSAICGELPAFGEDEHEIKRVCEIINTVRSHPIKPRLTSLDLESRFAIELSVDGKYEAYCGDMNSMQSKLDALESILTEEFCAKYQGATIDVSNPSTVGVVTREG